MKIKINKHIDLTAIKAVENKMLMSYDHNHLILINNVRTGTEEEATKRGKKIEVEYLYCDMYGWNSKGEFVGTSDTSDGKDFLEQFDILQLRKNYIEFERQWTMMHEKQERLVKPTQSSYSKCMESCISEVKQGNLLMATRIYKDTMGITLKEAKDYIFTELRPKYDPNYNLKT